MIESVRTFVPPISVTDYDRDQSNQNNAYGYGVVKIEQSIQEIYDHRGDKYRGAGWVIPQNHDEVKEISQSLQTNQLFSVKSRPDYNQPLDDPKETDTLIIYGFGNQNKSLTERAIGTLRLAPPNNTLLHPDGFFVTVNEEGELVQLTDTPRGKEILAEVAKSKGHIERLLGFNKNPEIEIAERTFTEVTLGASFSGLINSSNPSNEYIYIIKGLQDPEKIPDEFAELYGPLKSKDILKVVGLNTENNHLETAYVALISFSIKNFMKNCQSILGEAVTFLDHPNDIETYPRFSESKKIMIRQLVDIIKLNNIDPEFLPTDRNEFARHYSPPNQSAA